VLRADVVDGQPVYWLRVDTQMLPDVADGKLHEWAHDVAISQSTFEPVATRDTRDGKTGPDGNSFVLSIETLPAGDGDFPTAQPHSGRSGAMRGGRGETLTPAEASTVLARPALWAGESVDGLGLARVWKNELAHRAEGSTTWEELPDSVTFFYGTIEPDKWLPGIAPAGRILTPFVQISETTRLYDGFQRGVSNYSPPEGTILIFGHAIAVMQKDGLYLALEGSSEQVLLAAARALAAVPG
jgi:hypothetical protein